jgi:glycosyltransferase involved in cell wall biosynthesis
MQLAEDGQTVSAITHRRFEIQLGEGEGLFTYAHRDDPTLRAAGSGVDIQPLFVTSLRQAADSDANADLPDALRTRWSQRRPDVVHLHFTTGISPLVVNACEALAIPLVVTLHGMTNLIPVAGSFVRAGLSPADVMALLKRCDRVVVVSQPMLEHCRGAGLNHVRRIPTGIDTRYFTPPPAARRHDLLYVGKRNAHKGLRETIQAFLATTESQHHALRLVGRGIDAAGFAATGFDLPELDRTRAAELIRSGRMNLLGELSARRLRALYRRCKLLVLPSHSEGFPLVVLEALACGMPAGSGDGRGLDRRGRARW